MRGEVSDQPLDKERSSIPTASYDDVLHSAFSSEDDPQHRLRWLEFQDEQPILAQEVLDSMHSLVPDTAARKQVIDQVSLTYAALKNAIARHKNAGNINPAA